MIFVVLVAAAGAARAQAVCGRLDVVTTTGFDGTRATAAKLHVSWAWEGGSLVGFLWLTCAAGDARCQDQLLAQTVRAGTLQPVTFGARHLLHPAATVGWPSPLAAALLGTSPAHAVCEVAFGEDVPAVDAGVSNELPDEACAVAPGGGSPALLLLLVALRASSCRRRRSMLFPRHDEHEEPEARAARGERAGR